MDESPFQQYFEADIAITDCPVFYNNYQLGLTFQDSFVVLNPTPTINFVIRELHNFTVLITNRSTLNTLTDITFQINGNALDINNGGTVAVAPDEDFLLQIFVATANTAFGLSNQVLS